MNKNNIVTNSLTYLDKNYEKYEHLLKDITHISYSDVTDLDMERRTIYFYNKEGKLIFNSRFEFLLPIPKLYTSSLEENFFSISFNSSKAFGKGSKAITSEFVSVNNNLVYFPTFAPISIEKFISLLINLTNLFSPVKLKFP